MTKEIVIHPITRMFLHSSVGKESLQPSKATKANAEKLLEKLENVKQND